MKQFINLRAYIRIHDSSLIRSITITILIVASFIVANFLLRKQFVPTTSQRRLIKDEYLPVRSNCQYSTDGELTFDGQVIIHQKISQHLQSEKDWTKAVKSQINYGNGFFNSQKASVNEAKMFMVGEPNVEIKKIEQVSYNKKLHIDRVENDDYSKYPSALSNGLDILPKDKAFKISYSAIVPVIRCGAFENKSNMVRVLLPFDPYLEYWSVPKQNRLKRAYQGNSSITTPCADSEVADLKSPHMLWYVWNPEEVGKSLDNIFFDCKKILKPEIDYQVLSASFKEKKSQVNPVEFSQLLSKKEWNVSIILGYLKKNDSKSLSELHEVLHSDQSLLKLSKRYLSGNVKNINYNLEPSMMSLFQIIKTLNDLADIPEEKFIFKSNNGFYTLTFSGVFKKSQQPFKMNLYFGPTDVDQQLGLHLGFLAESFKNSDMIFYIGHSGMGKNFNLHNMKKSLNFSDTQMTEIFSKVSYQLISVSSCYSTNYYSTEYFDLRKHAGQTSDLVLTGSRNYLYWMPLQILSYLDSTKAGKKISLEKSLSYMLAPNEMVTLDRHKL